MTQTIKRSILAGAALLAIGGGAPLAHARPRACPGGEFLLRDAGPLARAGARTTLTVADGTAAIDGLCPSAAVTMTAGRRGTTVRATWTGCEGIRGRLRLKARIENECSTIAGVLRARRARLHHRIEGDRDPGCASDPDCHFGGRRCATSDDCADGAFCARRPGHCDGDGICLPRPAACPELYAPVCGCDGRTYGNRCEAAAAGVTIARRGRCECLDILCSPGTRPVDSDGDDCPDRCVAPCHDACDCYRNPGLEFPEPCPLDCATCDNYWTCEGSACAAHCGPVPPEAQECPGPTLCRSNDDCPARAYCAARPGSCDGPGVCKPRPDACTREYDPVCGCDGETYPNACSAAAAGVRVAADRPCACPQILCVPGTRPVDTDGDGCHDACRAPCEDVCDCERNPAIRCDASCPLMCPNCGQYFTCEEGSCIEHCGRIPPENLACHAPPACKENADCGERAFCARPPGHCEVAGVCEPRPRACIELYEPVCGCDGETYSNACHAAAHGVSVAARGPCVPVCGGIAGIPCKEGQVCELPPGMCQGADLQGHCVARPDACPDVWRPVCGCDGTTYGNDCERLQAGVQQAHAGACACPAAE